MFPLILNKVEDSKNILSKIKLGFSQLNQTVLSRPDSIKSLEAYLLALSAQMHNPTRGNDLLCMAITTKSSNPCESSLGSDTPLFGGSKEYEEVNKSNNILDQLESVCDIKDGDRITRAKTKMIEKDVTSQKLYIGADTSTKRHGKEDDKAKFQKFLSIFTSLSINIPLVEAFNKMLACTQFMKKLMTKKRALECEMNEIPHIYIAISTRHVAAKKDDPSASIIPCTIEICKFRRSLCDLEASVNLMPLLVFLNSLVWILQRQQP